MHPIAAFPSALHAPNALNDLGQPGAIISGDTRPGFANRSLNPTRGVRPFTEYRIPSVDALALGRKDSAQVLGIIVTRVFRDLTNARATAEHRAIAALSSILLATCLPRPLVIKISNMEVQAVAPTRTTVFSGSHQPPDKPRHRSPPRPQHACCWSSTRRLRTQPTRHLLDIRSAPTSHPLRLA